MLALVTVAAFFTSFAQTSDAGWPMGSGPSGNWTARGPAAPREFSVERNINIAWSTPLPETGQGGIAVHGTKLFVTTMAPWDPANALSPEDAKTYSHAIEKRSVSGKDIDAHCIDAETGKILWTKRIKGEVPSIYSYPFSDATSASPVTDGKHVWFTNGGGRVVCFTIDGEEVWTRTFTPTFDGPFNKQFEPMLVGDGERTVFINMEPFPAPDAKDKADLHGRWHHLVGIDALTGEQLWKSDDALTHYNAPTIVQHESGPAILIARGGPHQVPERPVGMSLVQATGKDAGKSLWRFEDTRGNHEASLHTMTVDAKYAYWVMKEPRSAVALIDLATGKELRELPLGKDATVTSYDEADGTWTTTENVTLDLPVSPARYSTITANGALYFQCYATAWGKTVIGPPYSFGRLDPETGNVSYLEVPTDLITSDDGTVARAWRAPRPAKAMNSRGVEVTGDDRSHWGGWDWVFNGSPTRVNDNLYFTVSSGLVYVLDANATSFTASALMGVGDLGPRGETWSANSVSYAGGALYHRTSAALLKIRSTGNQER